jgi:hypothetical protein
MNAGRMILGALLIGGLALPVADARACGRGAMAVPVPGYGMAASVALPPVGLTVGVLPPGFVTMTVNGVPFFRAGPVWYQHFRGPTGPLFRVVPAPHGM